MRLRIVMGTGLDEPDADSGLISWLDIEILDEGENDRAVVASRARAAIIHVGTAGSSLLDAMDADSGELEALYSAYFDGDSFKEEFAQGAGSDLFYVSAIELTPSYRGRGIEHAVVRRLCDTLGTGCELAVIAHDSELEAASWVAMGFEKTEGQLGLMHLKQAFSQPRVVRSDGDEERFRIVPLPSDETRRMN